MANASILVVEDDPNIREVVRLYLTHEGFRVRLAEDGREALYLFEQETPDLVVLDLMLPELDGWEVAREIRRRGSIPILMLTARGEPEDRLAGFDTGADDYVVKPFHPKELVARVRAILRRVASEAPERPVIDLDGLHVDLNGYQAIILGKPVKLPPKELELLHFLASRPGRVFSRDELLDRVWGFEYAGDTRTVDVHVKRLRDRLASVGSELGRQPDWQISTVWGVGYKFETGPARGEEG